MKVTRHIIAVGLVCGLVMVACSKDEPATEDIAETRGAGVQDSTKNDSTTSGGILLEIGWIP